jgi:hypothetical protein
MSDLDFSYFTPGVDGPGACQINAQETVSTTWGVINGAAAAIGAASVAGAVVVAAGLNKFDNQIKGAVENWQYEGCLEGLNNGIMGTNQTLDTYDAPINHDPFNPPIPQITIPDTSFAPDSAPPSPAVEIVIVGGIQFIDGIPYTTQGDWDNFRQLVLHESY